MKCIYIYKYEIYIYIYIYICIYVFSKEQRSCLDISLFEMSLLDSTDATPDLRLCKPKFSGIVVISDI